MSSKQSFEVGYNKACGLLDGGQLAAAEAELRAAIKLGEPFAFFCLFYFINLHCFETG